MVKCEEEGIRNNAKHPEDDKADYKTKPLQPYLYREKKLLLLKIQITRFWQDFSRKKTIINPLERNCTQDFLLQIKTILKKLPSKTITVQKKKSQNLLQTGVPSLIQHFRHGNQREKVHKQRNKSWVHCQVLVPHFLPKSYSQFQTWVEWTESGTHLWWCQTPICQQNCCCKPANIFYKSNKINDNPSY